MFSYKNSYFCKKTSKKESKNMWRKIKNKLYVIFCSFYYANLFARFGKHSILIKPTNIDFPKRIFIGAKVYIGYNAWLAANPLTGNDNCKLIIGDGTSIGRFSHIYATSKIEIGKKVLMAERVYISDNLHGYSDINLPIIDQPIVQIDEVVIGDDSWIGENVCIIGASIGKHSIIGANAVVTKSVPDYCIAVGAPAKIIKRYNFEKNSWQKTNDNGEFI
jgi:acetyltransferase-like isoleucine patch superfamily enzyme